MPSATKRIDNLVNDLKSRYTSADGETDQNVILAAQILEDLCSGDFRLADRADELIRSSEATVGRLDTDARGRVNNEATETSKNQKEVAAA